MSEQGLILDPPAVALIELAAAIAQGEESAIRDRIEVALAVDLPRAWVDELLLQSTLMVGWPRALSAATVWRSLVGAEAEGDEQQDLDYSAWEQWQQRGEATCRIIYGDNYSRLRENIRHLHPALGHWVITEAYGRTLSRQALPLKLREFCTIAQTAILRTPRQLHSHLRGALNAGATVAEVEVVLELVNPFIAYEEWKEIKQLWEQVRERWSELP